MRSERPCPLPMRLVTPRTRNFWFGWLSVFLLPSNYAAVPTTSATSSSEQDGAAPARLVSEKLLARIRVHAWTGPNQAAWHPESLRVSSDQRHMAYGEHWEGKWLMVIDGQAGKGYDSLKAERATFSPNGRRTGYIAEEEKQWFAVIDGEEG